MRILFIVLLAATLTGCATIYRTPVAEGGFAGLGTRLAEESIVRAVFVHGMCNHGYDWVRDRTDVLVKLFGTRPLERDDEGRYPIDIAEFPSSLVDPADPPMVYRRTFVREGYEMRAFFVVWSPLTIPLKRMLDFDDAWSRDTPDGQFTYQRATINAGLKASLINGCLADAVIYAGQYGKVLKKAMRQAICIALSDEAIPEDDCERGVLPAQATANPTPLVFVTESLGSKLMADAVLHWEVDDRSGAARIQAFATALAPTRQIFMMANQVPMLHLAGVRTAGEARCLVRGGLHGLVGLINSTKAADAPALSVVAFTDPNDLLSYRLPLDYFTRCGIDATVANLIVSNAPEILGAVENPYPAHTDYEANAAALRYLWCGTVNRGIGCGPQTN